MFAEVILHRRVPSNFESFTYEVPAGVDVTPGHMVRVPFKTQMLSGIVRAVHANAPKYPTKAISEVVALMLPEPQRELAEWMATHYKTSIAKVMDFFVPEKGWPAAPKKRVRKKKNEGEEGAKIRSESAVSEETSTLLNSESPTIDSRVQGLVKELIDTETNNTPRLVLERAPLARAAFYTSLAAALPKDAQILLLFPEVFSLLQGAPRHVGAPFHGELSENAKAHVWHGARDGSLRVIAGTRGALFLPFKKLGAIVLDTSHNDNYRERRAPYYHALDVARHMALTWNIPLIVLDPTPTVETWHAMQKGDYTLHEWNHAANQREKMPAIIDMAEERRKGNHGIFAPHVIEKIAAALAQNQQALFFVNRTGEANAVLCPDCNNVLRCEKCHAPLTLHLNSTLHCHRCKKKLPLPEACPHCGNVVFKNLGFGTERIEQELKKTFGKAKIVRLDARITAGPTATPLNDLLENADLIVGTQILDKPFNLPRIGLCVSLMPDPLLNFPHFRAEERALQILMRLKHLAHHGEFIIQTFLPEHRVYYGLTQEGLPFFYDEELTTRKNLHLPPFED